MSVHLHQERKKNQIKREKSVPPAQHFYLTI